MTGEWADPTHVQELAEFSSGDEEIDAIARALHSGRLNPGAPIRTLTDAEGTLAGFTAPIPAALPGEIDAVHIAAAAIDQKHEGEGVGDLLVEDLLEAIQEARGEIPTVWAVSESDNGRVQRLAERHGFEITRDVGPDPRYWLDRPGVLLVRSRAR